MLLARLAQRQSTEGWLTLERMEADELKELSERSRERGEKRIGLTMAITAVLLAVATMLAHRSTTEEVLLQTRAADQWSYYQAKNIRSHIYTADAEMAALSGAQARSLVNKLQGLARKEKTGAGAVQMEARKLEGETRTASHQSTLFDLGEIAFEVAIVLCSISLLTEIPLFWRSSFVASAAGLVICGVALLKA